MEMFECFRPNPDDLTVRAVTKPYEIAKGMYVAVEGETIQLRGKRGMVLERIPMHMVRWLPCSLPGGVDHCISLQYKEPQAKEIFLKTRTRAAVAHILTTLDAAAAKLSPRPPASVTVHATAHLPVTLEEPATSPSPIDASEEREQNHAPSRCPRCWQLAQLLDEHEAQSQDMEVLRADLDACRADVEVALRERDAALQERDAALARAARAAELARNSSKTRQAELETCLAEAAERCEKLLHELRVAADAADTNAARCTELQAALEKAEEEKKLLVDALTTAQAQLHDAQSAFKETASQLQGASRSCSNAKAQASAARSELAVACEDAASHADVAQKVQKELAALQLALEQAQQEAADSQRAWQVERERLEGALAAFAKQNNSGTSSSSDRSSAEAVVLRAQVDELKEQLSAAQAAAVGRQHEERTHAAEKAALRAQEELSTTKRALGEHYAGLKEEVKGLREQAAALALEAANSTAARDAERSAAQTAASEVAMLKERLTAALATQAATVKERNSVELAVDRSAVEMDRLRRRNEALEARCKVLEAENGKRRVD